jgi:zinc transport system substrate-binding protein
MGPKTMNRRILLFGCCLLLPVLSFVGCRADDPVWPKDGKIRVLTSIAPLYCFAQNVAGDDANVLCLSTTEGPHGRTASQRDYLMAKEANIIFAVGLELDDFMITIANTANNSKARFAVAEALPLEKLLRMAEGEHIHGPGEKHHHHGEFDPHVWLSPEHSILMVEAMAAKLGEIDGKNKEKYQQRAQTYIGELKKLHAYGKTALANKQNRKVISTHDALRYFAAAFGVEVRATIRPSPEDEPGGGKLSELMKICREQGVRVIAVEPQYPKRSAENLQMEAASKGIKIELVEIDPLETALNPDPGYYLKRMYENIDNLAKALP